MDKNEVLQSQENQTKNVIQEIKEEYTKTADFLEEHINQQLVIAKEMKEEMQNKDFDVNIKELKALKEEITELKAEIKRLNEMENITFGSLIIRDIKSVGNTLINLQEKAVGSIKRLYDNMKHQLSYNLTKAQEKFVQMKIGIVKGLVNSMQDFIKDQQKKLDTCLEKLDNLSKEIQKDEEKLGKDSLNKAEKPIEKKEQNERKKEGQKEKTEKKPSVLKKLKENQQRIKKEEKVRDVKITKKDKGMEI
ncbi:TPA: conjugal transfer protein [Streptococcus suis 92-1400]|uniref:conjugal transfer protein n=1 Tax=Streptococcus suis TaxID=1307 RepID=UPI000407D285|nr:conjugal transfer protein [Streptococcus suis]HEM3166366.1 conjugal transfer protein [Streptococcus suis 92-1400]